MIDDPFRDYREQIRALQEMTRASNPFSEQVEQYRRMLEQLKPKLSALEEAGRLAQHYRDMLSPPELAAYRQMMEEASSVSKYARQFLIENEAIRQIREHFAVPGAAAILERYRIDQASVAAALALARSPLEEFGMQARMISTLGEMHGIASIARSASAYDDWAASALRVDLGDWRSPIAISAEKLIEPKTRSELYVEMGFDGALVELPQPVFRAGMESSGLFVPDNDFEQVSNDDAVEQGFIRTNDAHNRLMRFEYGLRIFIEGKLSEVSGPDWAERHVPKQILDNWKAKRESAAGRGEVVAALIEYADFTDYQTIITKKENWRLAFERVFQNKASVEESFRRLYPVRIATMHARLIMNDDAVYLFSEILRLSRAIGI